MTMTLSDRALNHFKDTLVKALFSDKRFTLFDQDYQHCEEGATIEFKGKDGQGMQCEATVSGVFIFAKSYTAGDSLDDEASQERPLIYANSDDFVISMKSKVAQLDLTDSQLFDISTELSLQHFEITPPRTTSAMRP